MAFGVGPFGIGPLGVPAADLPAFVDTANVRSLYDWKPGESLDEAIARKKPQEG